MLQKKNIIAFLNAYTQGKSGGDIAFIEIFKRIKGINLFVVTSLLGKKLCIEKKMKATYVITSNEKQLSNIIFIYLKRTINVLLWVRKQAKSDVIYATSDALPDVLPAFFLKWRFGKNICWIQKIFHMIPQERLISHFAQRLSFLLIKLFADRIIVSSRYIHKELLHEGFSEDKTRCNYLGVDHDYIKKVPAAKKKFEGLFMGRLHKSKGIFDLPEIWRIVVNEIPTARLGIIGTGNKEVLSNLQKFISKHQLKKNIVILGYLSNRNAFSLIKSCKIFLSPSYEEGFGLALGEALACGTPVIAYQQTVFDELYNKLVIQAPPGNIDFFAHKVTDLIKNVKKRTVLKKNLRKLVKKFTWDKTALIEQQVIFNTYEEKKSII